MAPATLTVRARRASSAALRPFDRCRGIAKPSVSPPDTYVDPEPFTPQAKLISTGTYIILEKLKAAVYRTLFRKIHNTHKALEPGKPFQVPLPTLQAGLAWMGVTMDLDEVRVSSDLLFCSAEGSGGLKMTRLSPRRDLIAATRRWSVSW